MKELSLIWFFILLLLVTIQAAGQDTAKAKKQHKLGLNYGYGNQFAFDVMYRYNIHLIQLQYFFPIKAKRNFCLEFIVQHHFVLTSFKDTLPDVSFHEGYDFGLSGGLLARRKILKNSASLFSSISTGPHYLVSAPKRQTIGFIFAHYLFTGASIRLSKRTNLEMKAGVRHISNGSIKHPNGGINNFITSAGFYFVLN